jgi:MarR family transcriptional regulator for hemolysin
MDKLPLSTQMTSTLVRLARLYRFGVDGSLSGLGLSDALALPVVVLGRHPEGIRQNMLADELGVEGPSLVRLLDRLVDLGLAERRADTVDRRSKIVHLTPEGLALSRKASRKLDAYRAALLDGVEDADIEAALRVFEIMYERLLTTRRGHRP